MMMHPKISPVLILLFVSITVGCNNNHNNSEKAISIGLFDISKNDNQILFGLYNENKSGVYKINRIDGSLSSIVLPTNDSDYFNPMFNNDDSKILFLGGIRDSTHFTSIYVANADGSNRKRITNGKEIISEAIFSNFENKIYYIKSNEFGHYSPLSQNQVHGTDIYSLNLETQKVEKVTNYNAYSILRLSEYSYKKLIFYKPTPNQNGMFIKSVDTTNTSINIIPINDPRKNVSFYYTPLYSNRFNLLGFIAPYELYIMSMQDKYAKPVIKNSEKLINAFRFFNTQKKILFTKGDEICFYTVNFDGSGLKSIPIVLPPHSLKTAAKH